MTQYTWTVYVKGELFDIMTDGEVRELIQTWKVARMDCEHAVIEFD